LIEDPARHFAGFRRGNCGWNRENIELIPIVRSVVDASRPAANAKQLSVKVALDPAVGVGPCDPNRLQQVVWNLLSTMP